MTKSSLWRVRKGFQKSTALSIIAGEPEYFSDQTILGKSDKEQQELLRGVWVYEIADLTNIVKSEVEHVKAFASRMHDRARPAYGRARIDQPRRCVIWATTNNSKYLKSQTGNRRFWPFTVGEIDIEALKKDRDQLIAEAVVLEEAGASIVLPRELWSVAAVEQEERRENDPWEDVLRDFRGTFAGDNEYRVFSHDLLEFQIGIPKERQNSAQAKRISDCMRRLVRAETNADRRQKRKRLLETSDMSLSAWLERNRALSRCHGKETRDLDFRK